jgi:hypothetical protein
LVDQAASLDLNSTLFSGDGLAPEIVANNRILAPIINAPNTTSPKVAEPWHNIVTFANGWTKGTGQFKFKLLATGFVAINAQGLVPGTVADGTIIVAAANGPPALYQPATPKPLVADTNALKVSPVSSTTFENARLQFQTDGSITCSGFSTAATFANCIGQYPVDT